MAKKGYSEWTETYRSWEEYTRRNPNWNKHPSSRIAGAFVKEELDKNGVYIKHLMQIPFDPVVHREVCAFLKRLNDATKISRKSQLVFRVGISSLDSVIA
jgi:hypothetical protein